MLICYRDYPMLPNPRKLVDQPVILLSDGKEIEGHLGVGLSADVITHINYEWQQYRDILAQADPETLHSHWDWSWKSGVYGDNCQLLTIYTFHNKLQIVLGLLLYDLLPRISNYTRKWVTYVEFIESAPWNITELPSPAPRPIRGVGVNLIRAAVLASLEMGLDGRVGLSAIKRPRSLDFYLRHGMTPLGSQHESEDLEYFEYTEDNAKAFLD